MAKSLAQLREEAGLSQRDLAEALDLTPGAVGMYETGARTPRYPIMKKMVAVLSAKLNRPVRIDDISFGPDAHI